MKRLLLLAGLLWCALPTASHGQHLTIEPIAIGIRYLPVGAGSLKAGIDVIAGPQYSVQLGEAGEGSARSWAAAYLSVEYQTAGGLTLHAGPGAAMLVGNDYRAVYPSGQAGLGYGRGPLAVGTLVRVTRVPLADSRVEYRTSWVPIRLSYSLWR